MCLPSSIVRNCPKSSAVARARDSLARVPHATHRTIVPPLLLLPLALAAPLRFFRMLFMPLRIQASSCRLPMMLADLVGYAILPAESVSPDCLGIVSRTPPFGSLLADAAQLRCTRCRVSEAATLLTCDISEFCLIFFQWKLFRFAVRDVRKSSRSRAHANGLIHRGKCFKRSTVNRI